MKTCTRCKVEKALTEFAKGGCKGRLVIYCKECERTRNKAYKEANKEKLKAYRDANKQRDAEVKVAYRMRTKEQRAAWQKEYSKSRRTERLAYENNRRLTDPLYKLTYNIRRLIRISLVGNGFSKKSKTAELLGCTYDQLMAYLGSKPCDDAHLDHICPVAQARNEEEAIKLQHYSNLQWLSPQDNLAKAYNKTKDGEFMCNLLLGRHWL